MSLELETSEFLYNDLAGTSHRNETQSTIKTQAACEAIEGCTWDIESETCIFTAYHPAKNPRELEYYSHQITYTTDEDSTVTFTLNGTLPDGLTFYSSGLISGTVDWMVTQEECVPKKDDLYIEYDVRNYPDYNGRYVNDYYDFEFEVTAHTEYFVSVDTRTYKIRLVKDWDIDAKKMFRDFLDGANGRLPYYCKYSGPTNQAECELIGGVWNEEYQFCDINIPQTQEKTEELGAVWTASGADMALIQTQAECEVIGGVWTKNTLMHNIFLFDELGQIVQDENGDPIILSTEEVDNYARWIELRYS